MHQRERAPRTAVCPRKVRVSRYLFLRSLLGFLPARLSGRRHIVPHCPQSRRSAAVAHAPPRRGNLAAGASRWPQLRPEETLLGRPFKIKDAFWVSSFEKNAKRSLNFRLFYFVMSRQKHKSFVIKYRIKIFFPYFKFCGLLAFIV